jgi:uncharacterized membrane protein
VCVEWSKIVRLSFEKHVLLIHQFKRTLKNYLVEFDGVIIQMAIFGRIFNLSLTNFSVPWFIFMFLWLLARILARSERAVRRIQSVNSERQKIWVNRTNCSFDIAVIQIFFSVFHLEHVRLSYWKHAGLLNLSLVEALCVQHFLAFSSFSVLQCRLVWLCRLGELKIYRNLTGFWLHLKPYQLRNVFW